MHVRDEDKILEIQLLEKFHYIILQNATTAKLILNIYICVIQTYVEAAIFNSKSMNIMFMNIT